ncbi:MAG: flagellar export chaperone FlgN [Candidatus Sericytochromatia bacterium]|nr:flagellar export chaperone FlgN [Candidatus Sericytochromatia bacterium]
MAEFADLHQGLYQALQQEAAALQAVLDSLQQQQTSLIAQQPEQIRACSQHCEQALQTLERSSQSRAALMAQAGWASLQEALTAAETQAHPESPQLRAVAEALLALIPQLNQAQYTTLALIQQGQALTENTLETLVHLQQEQAQPATYSGQGLQNNPAAAQAAAALYDFNV